MASFSSDRMVREYVEQAYLPAADAYRERAAEDGREAARLEGWHRRLRTAWPALRFGRLEAAREEGAWRIGVEVDLAGLETDDVLLELVADGLPDGPPVTAAMAPAARASPPITLPSSTAPTRIHRRSIRARMTQVRAGMQPARDNW